MPSFPSFLTFSPAVRSALESGSPVVALESTVLTHGLPYPQNLQVLRALEDILLNAGVTPATIIVLDSQAHIGLEESLAEELAPRFKEPGSFAKLGARDLATAFTRSLSGGTTVSATMQLAALSGIEIFATGGIGGVHRGWNKTLDISTDLTALSQIPVAVVSAGCKAVLDISATLECLETLGVPVLGWQCERFPLFYTRESDYPIDRIDSAEQFASFWHAHKELGGKGVLIANPIPAEAEIPGKEIGPQIEVALFEAQAKGISGKALTPFLLDYLAQATKGGSVEANLALLKNNVRLASELALALQRH